MNRRALLTAIFGIVVATIPGFAEDPLRGVFWARADILDLAEPGGPERGEDGYTDNERRALEELLEEARWVFSGMIYGMDFSWTPPDTARGVDDVFRLEPLAMIPRGDPRLTVVSTVPDEGFLYVTLSYQPDAVQAIRLEGWKGNRYPIAAGAGRGELTVTCRRAAIEEAAKQAIRSWLRVRIYNRPREAAGRFAFREVPTVSLHGPGCLAQVSLRLDIVSVRKYPAD